MKALVIPPVSLPSDSKSRRSHWCSVFPAASFLFLIFFALYAFIAPDYKERLSRWGIADTFQNFKFSSCKNQCRPPGSESLPEGIVSKTSNFQMRPLWGFPKNDENSPINLLAVAVGITQRDLVNKMVKKFLSSNFSVMLFHYDGIVDEWRDFEWNDRVIHVSARNQTKWWFAKRFLHPDIVAACNYIFLWDEDLGVENFNPKQYVSIVKSEGLHISQPALDYKSLVHQQITVRASKSGVHRFSVLQCLFLSDGICSLLSEGLTSLVFVMEIVPLLHAQGKKIQLCYISVGGNDGPCFLESCLALCVVYDPGGDRTKNIGIVDAEYIVHYGHPTLGGVVENEEPSRSQKTDPRLEVRRQSLIELRIFQKRWKEAVEEDQCWIDPYKEAVKESS
ncbi:hypothetical protein POTOM_058192 [Populus tomentosa]|uniref:Uncharacterized protein n=1 Tax=Populus tomentosa TaxID=118781 RepID=A0A8X7XXB9_POPTO|nr:hypothetical protein POTOM_058192 [Populus tomentosa]